MSREADILIKNITILRPDQAPEILRDTDIVIADGKIVKIGNNINIDAKQELNGRGKIALPGLVDAHTHVFQIFLRGALTMRELQRHPIWLNILIPFEAEVEKEEAEMSAKLACLNMIKKGITAFSDAGGPYPEILAEIVSKSGLKATVTHSTIDTGISSYLRSAELNRELVHKCGAGRVRGWYSLRQIITSTDEMVEKTFKYAEEDSVGIHMHFSEEPIEIQHSLSMWGKRPVEFLYSKGYLNHHVVAAHCAFLSKEEVKMLSRSNAKVVHCPTINMMYMNFLKFLNCWLKELRLLLEVMGGVIEALTYLPK